MILTLNAGSSPALKFALFADTELRKVAGDTIERIAHADHASRLPEIFAAIGDATLAAVGHRVVHGGPRLTAPGASTTPAARRAARADPARARARAGGDRADRRVRAQLPGRAAGRVLRHRLPRRPAARAAAPADPARVTRARRAPLRLPRPLVRVPVRRSSARRRSRGGARPRRPRPSRQRRQPGGAARRPLRRHDDGFTPAAGLVMGDAQRRSRSRPRHLPGARRRAATPQARRAGQARVRSARPLREQRRHARSARARSGRTRARPRRWPCSATRRGSTSARSPPRSAASTRSSSPAASASTRADPRAHLRRPRPPRPASRRRAQRRPRAVISADDSRVRCASSPPTRSCRSRARRRHLLGTSKRRAAVDTPPAARP